MPVHTDGMRAIEDLVRWHREAVQQMSLDGETLKTGILGSSIKETADATLFLELALRGYDLSKLRDDEPTGEIVKIS